MLLRQSIQMTFEHPIFGVGPGVFAAASWDERKRAGIGAGNAQVTHNTYTQISSETGIPGFFFFIATVFLSFKYTLSRLPCGTTASIPTWQRADSTCWQQCLDSERVSSSLVSAIPICVAVMFAFAASLHQIVKKIPGGARGDERLWATFPVARLSATTLGNDPAAHEPRSSADCKALARDAPPPPSATCFQACDRSYDKRGLRYLDLGKKNSHVRNCRIRQAGAKQHFRGRSAAHDGRDQPSWAGRPWHSRGWHRISGPSAPQHY